METPLALFVSPHPQAQPREHADALAGWRRGKGPETYLASLIFSKGPNILHTRRIPCQRPQRPAFKSRSTTRLLMRVAGRAPTQTHAWSITPSHHANHAIAAAPSSGGKRAEAGTANLISLRKSLHECGSSQCRTAPIPELTFMVKLIVKFNYLILSFKGPKGSRSVPTPGTLPLSWRSLSLS